MEKMVTIPKRYNNFEYVYMYCKDIKTAELGALCQLKLDLNSLIIIFPCNLKELDSACPIPLARRYHHPKLRLKTHEHGQAEIPENHFRVPTATGSQLMAL